ncbi:MAG: hypothetical protein HYT75_05940, partial [Deltaproteobacteria bacterium]|nr:hypothetical protein [Deltaproteobacteria bacterium]
MPISFDPLSAGIPALSIKSLEREMFGPAFMGADDSFGLGSSLYASPFFDEGPIGISAPIGNYNRFAANSPIGLLGIGSVDFVSSFIDSAKAYRDRGGWKMPEYDYSVFNPSSANAPHEAKRHDEIPDASDDMSSEDPHAAHKKEAEEAETAEEVAIDPVGSE